MPTTTNIYSWICTAHVSYRDALSVELQILTKKHYQHLLWGTT